jgi:uncharacterized membrane protein
VKSVVFGVFENTDDARRVLHQLADSPLDLDTVRVVHADPDVQASLAAEIGLPRDRAVPTGVVVGALLGAMLGAYAGTSWLASLGVVLAAAAGMLLGAVAGALVGAFGDKLRMPDEDADALLEEMERGATVVLVRTTNLPTARAVSDLFIAGGSMPPRPGSRTATLKAVSDHTTDALTRGAEAMAVVEELSTDEQSTVDTVDQITVGDTPPVTEEDELFAPPWRRTPFAARPTQQAAVPPIAAAETESEDDRPADATDADGEDDETRAAADSAETDDALIESDVEHSTDERSTAPDNADPADTPVDTAEEQDVPDEDVSGPDVSGEPAGHD